MDRDGRPGWLPSMGFAFLSFNCGMAVYRSWDDPYAVGFVLASYVALVLLYRCLHLLEHRRDQRLKLAFWDLSTLLASLEEGQQEIRTALQQQAEWQQRAYEEQAEWQQRAYKESQRHEQQQQSNFEYLFSHLGFPPPPSPQ